MAGLKDRLIREVSESSDLNEDQCRDIINHQFNFARIFIHNNEVGEIHLTRLGKLVSTEGRVKYITKKKKEAKENKKNKEL